MIRLPCRALMLKYLKAFTADDAGAITVDFVVLTGAATGMALAAMAAFSAEIGFISGEVAARSQHEEARPSFAYRAHDKEIHIRYAAAVSTLSDDDLAVLSSWGNATRAQQDGTADPAAVRSFQDFDNAITLAYANRAGSRDADASDYEEYDLQRVSRKLGFSGGGGSP